MNISTVKKKKDSGFEIVENKCILYIKAIYLAGEFSLGSCLDLSDQSTIAVIISMVKESDRCLRTDVDALLVSLQVGCDLAELTWG